MKKDRYLNLDITWGQECCEARGNTGSVGQVIGTIGLFA